MASIRTNSCNTTRSSAVGPRRGDLDAIPSFLKLSTSFVMKLSTLRRSTRPKQATPQVKIGEQGTKNSFCKRFQEPAGARLNTWGGKSQSYSGYTYVYIPLASLALLR